MTKHPTHLPRPAGSKADDHVENPVGIFSRESHLPSPSLGSPPCQARKAASLLQFVVQIPACMVSYQVDGILSRPFAQTRRVTPFSRESFLPAPLRAALHADVQGREPTMT